MTTLEQKPCEDAISRREAIKMFTYNYKGERISDYDCDNFPVQIAMKTVKEILRELPTVKLQERTGHWIEKDYLRRGIVYSCSKCGSFVHEKTNFCPDCGANMSENPIDSKVI